MQCRQQAWQAGSSEKHHTCTLHTCHTSLPRPGVELGGRREIPPPQATHTHGCLRRWSLPVTTVWVSGKGGSVVVVVVGRELQPAQPDAAQHKGYYRQVRAEERKVRGRGRERSTGKSKKSESNRGPTPRCE